MGLAHQLANPCGPKSNAFCAGVACLVLIACVVTLAVGGTTFTERMADDWYDFRDGRSTCALLNRSVVPFRAFRLVGCSACSPPTGNTGALGSSCSAYSSYHTATSPYSSNGAPGSLTNGAVCSTGRTQCCREECDTCRSCTGTGSDRSCTNKECNCRCVSTGTEKCTIQSGREFEKRLGLWVSDRARKPSEKPIAVWRGFYAQDLETPEQFAAQAQPYGRTGFASEAAAEAGDATSKASETSSIAAAVDLLSEIQPQGNCFTAQAFSATRPAGLDPYQAPSQFGGRPSTVLLSDSALRQRYLPFSSGIQAGPGVPESLVTPVSKGELRFASEVAEVPEWYWLLFVPPGLVLAMVVCCLPALALGQTPTRQPSESCFPCLYNCAGTRAGAVFTSVCCLIVIPCVVFVPSLVSLRAAREEQGLYDALVVGIFVWFGVAVCVCLDGVPATSVPQRIAIALGLPVHICGCGPSAALPDGKTFATTAQGSSTMSAVGPKAKRPSTIPGGPPGASTAGAGPDAFGFSSPLGSTNDGPRAGPPPSSPYPPAATPSPMPTLQSSQPYPAQGVPAPASAGPGYPPTGVGQASRPGLGYPGPGLPGLPGMPVPAATPPPPPAYPGAAPAPGGAPPHGYAL